MEGDQECLQACPRHICCHILLAGEFTSLLHTGLEVIFFTLTCEFNSLLHAGVEVGDEAHTGPQDLSNQVSTPLGVLRLVG
jgi:hypothetical protein